MSKQTRVFFYDNKGLNAYLKAWKNGTFPMGLSTGMPELDAHFLFKPGQLNIYGGIDNTGKSTVIWFLMVVASLLHGWKWLMYCAENDSDSVILQLIEFYSNKKIDKMSEMEIEYAKQWVLDHFKMIETEGLPTYKDIIGFVEGMSEYDGLFVDPWNAMVGSGTGNTHEQDYEAIKHLKQLTKEQGKCVYISAHVTTYAARIDKETQETPAPKKADIEGGNKFANKADDVVMIHRHVYDNDRYMDTELHVAKVKKTQTGGRVTKFAKPIILTALPGLCGFKCNGVDPVYNYWSKKSENHKLFFDKHKEEEEPF